MKEERFFYCPAASNNNSSVGRSGCEGELSADEAFHAIHVLRLKAGDEIYLIDGIGTCYRAVLTFVSGHHCKYNIVGNISQKPSWMGHIHLAIAPTKSIDRMEWLAEKATEIGFDELSFLRCDYSLRTVIRDDRIRRIIIASMKQSHKAWMPQVNAMTPFMEYLANATANRSATIFIAHCHDELAREDFYNALGKLPSSSSVTLLVGPEGDFSLNEVRVALSAGCRSVTLGDSRLRTETAGLFGVAMMQLRKRKSYEY